MIESCRWNKELFFRVPAVRFFCQLHFLRTEGCAVNFAGVVFIRTAVTDMGSHGNDRRTVRYLLCRPNRCIDCFDIVPVSNGLHMPFIRFEALHPVLGEREVSGSIDTDVVVVV